MIYRWSNGEEHDYPEHLGGWIALDGRSITPSLWGYLVDRYHPRSMLDVGCGEGWPVLWFLARGLDAAGVDGDARLVEANVIPEHRFMVHDFSLGRLLQGRLDLDLVLSVEFVEHVDEQFLPNILDVFSRARVVAMTHAWVNQGGHHHVNCQDQPYWVEKLASIGFRLDEVATRETRALPEVQKRDAYWGRTGLVFVR